MKSLEESLLPFLGFCKFIVQVALLKYTKTFIKTMLYNFNNSIVSALKFNILKTNLFKIASKEVKIYVFENYFLKKGVVQQLHVLWAAVSR